MKRLEAGLRLCAILSLCACDPTNGGKSAGGGSLTAAAPGQGSSEAGEEAGQTAAALERQAAAMTGQGRAAGGDDPLPGGEVFDNSRGLSGSASGGGVVRASGDFRGRAQPVRFTGPARRNTVRAGQVPALAGRLPGVALPSADPATAPRGVGRVLAEFDAFQRRTFDSVIPIISRAGWGAAARRGKPAAHSPRRVTVHHTEGHARTELSQAIEEMRGYQAFHMGPERGWADVGYHFVVDYEGRLYEGRHADVLGAHAGGANAGNLGVALMGNYNRTRLSAAQKTTLRRLIVFLSLRYKADPSARGFIQPHRHYNATNCPGSHVMAFLDELRREVESQSRTLARGGAVPDAKDGFQPFAVVSPG